MLALRLTAEQRAALDELSGAEAIPVFDPSDNRAYFLVPAGVYERLRKGDNADVEAFYSLMNEVAAREGWDDPEMEAYDKLDPRRSS
jgi:hypothetical protein